MQGEENVDIRLDTDVLGERNHGKVAWSDGYQVELLTEKSGKELILIDELKEKQRLELTQDLFLDLKESNLTAQEVIQDRMTEMPIFVHKTDYYSLNSVKATPEPGIGLEIGVFICLGIIGYLLGRV